MLPPPKTGSKSRRRGSKPEQFTVFIERAEAVNFAVEIKNAQDLRLLVDGFELRLAVVEDAQQNTGPVRANGHGTP